MDKQIKNIVKNLISATISEDISWHVPSNKKSDSNLVKTLETLSEDRKTIFSINISYKIDKNKVSLKDSVLWITNNKLPNGQHFIDSFDYKEVSELRDVLVERYIDIDPISEISDIFWDISQNISKRLNRENKIDSLDNDNNK